MVAVLVKIFGTTHLELAEDMVQDTLIQAINTWKLKGIPDHPKAWLYKVARNKAIDVLRKNKYSVSTDFSETDVLLKSEYTLEHTVDRYWDEKNLDDNLLWMMFTCCDRALSSENQITLILKSLCGFSTAEIASALLTNEETVSKRLYRTKEYFRQHQITLHPPVPHEINERLDNVLHAVYLLFNSGYHSSHHEKIMRIELMEEAMALCKILTEHPICQKPQTYALMSLMCLHYARNESRLTPEGEIILLEDQDRSVWSAEWIQLGAHYLEKASFGDEPSRYHLEAAIAYEHCTAPSLAETKWEDVLNYYTYLLMVAPSVIVQLNYAAVLFKARGSEESLTYLASLNPDIIENQYLYHCLAAELHTFKGEYTIAKTHYTKALKLSHSEKEIKLLRRKMEGL